MRFSSLFSRNCRCRLPADLLVLAASASAVTVAVTVAVIAPAPVAYAQNLVANPGFESGLSGWTVTPSPVNSIIEPTTTSPSHTGTTHVRFGSADPAGDSLSQNIATTAGAQYTFSFWFRNDTTGDDRFTAFWDGASVLNLNPTTDETNNPAENNYIRYLFNVTASTSSMEIRFNAYDASDFIHLDDVSVTANDPTLPTPPTAVTPEASSIVNLAGALLGPGVLGIVAVRKQQRRRAR